MCNNKEAGPSACNKIGCDNPATFEIWATDKEYQNTQSCNDHIMLAFNFYGESARFEVHRIQVAAQ